MGKKIDCNENCFECKFADCIVSTSQKERERHRLYYHKQKEKRKTTKKE